MRLQKVITFFLSVFTGFFLLALPAFASGTVSVTNPTSYTGTITLTASSFSPSYSSESGCDVNMAHGFYLYDVTTSNQLNGSGFNSCTSSSISFPASIGFNSTDTFYLYQPYSNDSGAWISNNFNYVPPPTPTPTPYIALSDSKDTASISGLASGLSSTGIGGLGTLILIGGVLLITCGLLYWIIMKFRGLVHI